MKLASLKQALQEKPAFADLSAWTFTPLRDGIVSPHKYKLARGRKAYFVKETTDAESAILAFLAAQKNLRLTPPILYPDLLARNILVQHYVPGRRAAKPSPALLAAVAAFQDLTNTEECRRRFNKYNGCTSPYKDDGFFRRWIAGDFGNDAYLRRLKKEYGLPIIDKYLAVFSHIKKSERRIVADYASMPFALLHNDLKEEHIIGTPQRLVDWGSFYSYGPFLKDVGLFLLADRQGLRRFARASAICRRHSAQQLHAWVYAAACAHFLSFIKGRLCLDARFRSKRELAVFMRRHYKRYRKLLETNAPARAGQK